MKININII